MGFSGDLNIFTYILLTGIAVLVLMALMIPFTPVFIALALARRQAEKYKNIRISTVITQFDPPRDLSPAEVGFLYDMKCDHKELIATLFDLKGRDVIKFIDKNNIEVINRALYDKLNEYEKIAIRLANSEITKTEAPRNIDFTYLNNQGEPETMTIQRPPKANLRAFRSGIRRSLNQKGFNVKDYWSITIGRSLLFSVIISLWPLFFISQGGTTNNTNYPAWSSQSFESSLLLMIIFDILFFPAYFIASFLVITIWTKITGNYWLNSKEARNIWPELEGYKRFIEVVELDNIQFESSQASSQNFNKAMPYAIVFGMDTKWKELLTKTRTH